MRSSDSCSSRRRSSVPTSPVCTARGVRRATECSFRSSARSTASAASTPSASSAWTVYAVSLLAFSAVSVVGLYLLQRVQGALPLNPTDVVAVPPALAFNTAASFVTNTNWQNYGGESTMSHLTQMAGLTVQNFVVGRRRDRGRDRADPRSRPARVRRRSGTSGSTSRGRSRASSFRWPSSSPSLFVSQGVVQTLRGPANATTVERRRPDDLPRAGRQPGSDQGARDERRRPVNANSAHPFENPSGLTNLLEMWALLLIPFALTYTFGRLAKDQPPGLGALRGDVRPLDRRGRGRDGVRGSHGQPARSTRRAEHGRQRGALRRPQRLAFSRRDDRHFDRCGHLRPTTASRRSAAQSRSST